MPLIVRAFPVNCDRTEVEAFASEVRARGDEARRFYSEYGVRREAWFFQDTDSGPLVIGVTDANDQIERNASRFAESNEEFAAWMKGRILSLSGVDENEQPLGPPTELVFDSSGAELPPGIMLSARIYPAKSREAVLELVNELQSRAEETRAFYEGFEVPREVWYLQEIDKGRHVVLGVTAIGAPERTSEYAETNEPFAAWFKQRVVEVTGVDPNVTPLGPPSEQVFDYVTYFR